MNWLPWSLALAASLHIVEEFFFPGGFGRWYRAYRPDISASMTPRFFIVINALLIGACLTVGSLGSTPQGVAAWLTIAALVLGNGLFHLLATLRTRHYSPGVVTGVLIYVPLTINAHYLMARQASFGTAVAAFVLGSSYPAWSAALHRRRARAAKGMKSRET